MTTPRITRTGSLQAHGREVEVIGPDHLSLCLDATADETEDARALAKAGAVRVTIEPADATPEEAPHGSALDYLAQAKQLLESRTFDAFVTGCGEEFGESQECARLLSLLNSTHLAILNERRK